MDMVNAVFCACYVGYSRRHNLYLCDPCKLCSAHIWAHTLMSAILIRIFPTFLSRKTLSMPIELAVMPCRVKPMNALHAHRFIGFKLFDGCSYLLNSKP